MYKKVLKKLDDFEEMRSSIHEARRELIKKLLNELAVEKRLIAFQPDDFNYEFNSFNQDEHENELLVIWKDKPIALVVAMNMGKHYFEVELIKAKRKTI